MKEYKAIKVPPEVHKKLKVLSASENKDMIEMLDILIELYKQKEGK